MVAEREGHVKLVKSGQEGDRVVIVPPAARGTELALGTLKAVREQAGMEREEFEALAAKNGL